MTDITPTSDEGTTAEAGDNNTQSTFVPPATQEELNQIIERRLARERKRYADYETLKEKAARYDEAETAGKSEAQKAAEELAAARAEIEALKQSKAQAERDKLAAEIARVKGVPAKYLRGDDEESLTQSADEFLADLNSIRPEPVLDNKVPGQGTGDPSASVDETIQARERAKNYKL